MNALIPDSNSTVLPFSGLASNARQARSMRLASSTGDHFDHIALGALPYMAPPSSFCELPRIDQSFMPRFYARRPLPGRPETTRRRPFFHRGLVAVQRPYSPGPDRHHDRQQKGNHATGDIATDVRRMQQLTTVAVAAIVLHECAHDPASGNIPFARGQAETDAPQLQQRWSGEDQHQNVANDRLHGHANDLTPIRITVDPPKNKTRRHRLMLPVPRPESPPRRHRPATHLRPPR